MRRSPGGPGGRRRAYEQRCRRVPWPSRCSPSPRRPAAATARLVRARVTAGRGDGIRYAIPAGWHAAPRSLTPHLLDPRERPHGRDRPAPPGRACAQNPGAALAAMGRADVLGDGGRALRLGPGHSAPPAPLRRLPRAVPSEAQGLRRPRRVVRDPLPELPRRRPRLPRARRRRPRRAARPGPPGVVDPRFAADRAAGGPVRLDPNYAIPYDDPARGLHLVMPDRLAGLPAGAAPRPSPRETSWRSARSRSPRARRTRIARPRARAAARCCSYTRSTATFASSRRGRRACDRRGRCSSASGATWAVAFRRPRPRVRRVRVRAAGAAAPGACDPRFAAGPAGALKISERAHSTSG